MSQSTPPHRRSHEDRVAAEKLLAALRGGADVRRKVRRVRGAVRASAYENPLKLHVALNKLADELS
jgi:hypothetical protein